jgi:hypothetical protein
MAYQRIFWKDRIVVLNDDGTINKIVQEGTPLSAFNLNHMEEGISKTYNDTDLIKKNQLELLIARDLEDKRVSMDEGYWFDSLKNENKVNSKSNTTISGNKLGLSSGKSEGNIEFKTHDIGFKSNKTTYFHKRKASYAQLYSATNKNVGENTIDVVAEIITINY